MSRLIQYDGSFDGLLSAVFYVYARKIPLDDLRIRSSEAPVGLFDDADVVTTDAEHAARVFTRLQKSLTRRGMITLLYGFLSNDDAMPDTFLRIVRRTLAETRNPLHDYGAAEIVRWMGWVKSVGREKHHMEAFVRFEAHDDGLYFARIEPRHDVLPLIMPHFCRRFPTMRFAIYDTARGYGIYHQDKQLQRIGELDDKNRTDTVSADEAFYRALWRQYFSSTTITSRINRKLQRQHMPQRYWKYLTEKQLK